MIDRDLVLLKMSADDMPIVGDARFFSISSIPEIFQFMGDERQVVSHSLTLTSDGDILLSMFVERERPSTPEAPPPS